MEVTRILRRYVLAPVVCAALAPAAARAQEVSARVMTARPSGDEMATLVGGGAGVRFSNVLVAGRMLSGSTRKRGVPCGGFIFDLESCREQIVDLDARLIEVTVGYAVASIHSSWRSSLVPRIGLTHLWHEKRGTETRASIDGRGGGAHLGAEAAVGRLFRSRMFVGVVGDVAWITGSVSRCSDCYEPFYDGITLAGLGFQLGYSFR